MRMENFQKPSLAGPDTPIPVPPEPEPGIFFDLAYQIFWEFVSLAWMWLPIAFAAFAIGRRRFSLRSAVIFLILEAVALAYFANKLRGEMELW
jgi:hypothetical protein